MIARADRVAATAIAVVVCAVTLGSSTRQGITRDEAYYMNAGERYVRYYEDALRGRLPGPLSDRSIWRYWSYNDEHPPLLKTLCGVSWRVLHRCSCAADSAWHPDVARITSGHHATLALLSEVTAFRLPTALCFGALCALLYLFFVEALGSPWGAWMAALLMFAQPRAFFHAETASFDLPVATLWFATTFAYWRAVGTTRWRPTIVTGLLFGLCLATKLNTLLLPVALVAHSGWLAVRGRTAAAKAGARCLAIMAMLGPVVMLSLWPWLWHDTIVRLQAYVAFHWHHVQFDFEYLGRNFNQPPYPWSEPLGMLVFTAPVILLLLAGAGILLLAARSAALPDGRERATRMLMLLAGLAPVAPFLAGTLPIYGETKHWLATMPFLALAAGYAVDRLRRALVLELRLEPDYWRSGAVSTALVLAVFAPAAAETIHSHPYGLSHYNALAGGPPGGADLGMNRQFWGYSVNTLLPWLNASLPPRARLYPHDWNYDAWELYVRGRQLRPDIIDTGRVDGSDAAVVIHERHFNAVDFTIWQEYGHVQPARVVTLDGVPLVSVYLRRK